MLALFDIHIKALQVATFIDTFERQCEYKKIVHKKSLHNALHLGHKRQPVSATYNHLHNELREIILTNIKMICDSLYFSIDLSEILLLLSFILSL